MATNDPRDNKPELHKLQPRCSSKLQPNELCIRKKIRRGKKIKSKMKNFTIYFNNVRGVNSKLDSIKDFAKELKPTMICLVETHLAKNDKIEIDGYSFTHHNRNEKGGGIAFDIKEELKHICTVICICKLVEKLKMVKCSGY